MPNTKSNFDPSSIRVEILDCKPNGFFIQDLEEYENLEELTSDDLEFSVHFQSGTNEEDGLFKIDINIDAYLGDESDEVKSLFGVKSYTVFRIQELDKIVEMKDEPGLSPFMKKLFNICIGGIRGILATHLMNTPLNNITLPLMDLGEMERQ